MEFLVVATVAAALGGSIVGFAHFIDWGDKTGAIMIGVLFALLAFLCVMCGP